MPGRISHCEVEDLVVETGDLPGAGLDVPPDFHVAGRGRGREVEGAGRVGAPVHQQLRVVISVRMNPEPTDIAELAVGEFEAAKAEPVLGSVKLSYLLAVHCAEGVPLDSRLMGTAALAQHSRQTAIRALPQVVKPGVQQRDVFLLAIQFRV